MFDEEWIRLAIVVHESSAEAVAWVLDDAICNKHSALAGRTFEERLEEALRLEQSQLARSLLNYQVPVVFPTAGFGKYADFDIGIIQRLIKYFVGNSCWTNAIAGLPAVENLQTYDWAKSNPHALVALLADFRNWTFHHPGNVLDFNQRWDDVLSILQGLKYDVSKISHFKTGPIDFSGKVIEKAIQSLLSDAVCMLKQELVSKEELIVVRGQLESLQEEIQKLKASKVDCVKNDQVQRAREALLLAHEAIWNIRELDLYGDQIESKRKVDLMVSLLTLKCSDVDQTRFSPSKEPNLEAVAMHDMFKNGKVVLVRGLPGSGKTTFCQLILREWHEGRLWIDRYDFVFYINAPFLASYCRSFSVDRVLEALYPDVFSKITYEQLRGLRWLVIVDSIDECDVEKICSPGASMFAEDALRQLILSRDSYDRIIVGRPHVCDEVRGRFLAHVAFQYVEVVGFAAEQLKVYVEKFCAPDAAKAADVWRKMSENKSLLSMAHLPVFASVACNILSEHRSAVIETQTELYVWTYVVFVTRHVRRHLADVDTSTFRKLLWNTRLIDSLVKVSKIAYDNLTSGTVFFSPKDVCFGEVEYTLITPFVVRRQEFLCFAHFTLMEFLSAVHLFVSRVKFSDELFNRKCFRGVWPILFGLLGASMTNSEAPEVVRDFVRPLMERFRIEPFHKHFLPRKVSKSMYRMGKILYISLYYELRSPGLLKSRNFYWDNSSELNVYHHHELDRVLYFMKHFVVGNRRIEWLRVRTTDDQLSLGELEKLHECIVTRGCKVEALVLRGVTLSDGMMELLAPVCSLIPTVSLRDIRTVSDRCWRSFVSLLETARRKKTLHTKLLWVVDCGVDQAILDELKSIVPSVSLTYGMIN